MLMSLTLEELERRLAPALIASQIPLTTPTLTAAQVNQLLQRAAAATSSDDAIVAIVDRGGNILGVRVEGGVSSSITSNPTTLGFAIDGALAEARTGAYFSSDAAPLTSRTIQFISQSTILQREVDSSPNNPDPTLAGPGLVAPIGIGGHYPPGINNTPLVDLFEIELTNRDGMVSMGPGGELVPYGINPADIPAGNLLTASGIAYGQAIMTPADQTNPAIPKPTSPGIGTLPGGLPIYEYGELVGGIGVFFPGKTGFASEENSSLNVNFDPTKPDRSLEAEFIALAAIGGSSGAGFPVGSLGGVPALPNFDLPFDRIDLAGITLPGVGPGGDQGPSNLIAFAQANYAIGQGNPNSGVNESVDSGGDLFKNGAPVPSGWLVVPHAGGNLSAAEVEQIINQGIATAQQTRSQLRLPIGDTSRMVFAVADSSGEILGLYRMPDSPVFSIDVAIAKARNTAYYDDPAQLQAVDQVPGLPAGVAMTSRTFRYLADPRFPEGVDGSQPAPFSILNSPGIDPATGLNVGPPLQAAEYNGTVLGYAAFNANTNFHAMTLPQFQNGVVFFPGSSPVYATVGGGTQIAGGFGVSGDGVNQDDFITFGGISGFAAPTSLAADQYFVRGVRLPYFKFPPNPTN
jgi:uncharacterized protein GlcG (DUF336 family)